MFKVGVLFVVFIVLIGCVISCSEIKLSELLSVVVIKVVVVFKNKMVLLWEVFDECVFEDVFLLLSIFLLGFEGFVKSIVEIKVWVIGCKCNGFGKVLGDVLLENGMMVSQVMCKNIIISL